MSNNLETFKYYNHLGFINPYYVKKHGKIHIFEQLQEAISFSNEANTLDITSIIEILSRGFCFSDRTIISRINKTPWMAKPNNTYSEWEYYPLPNHADNRYDLKIIADNLYNLLEEELLSYCYDKSSVGLLISGGMDSRITAGILNNLIRKGVLKCKVLAITWGIENSRDVIYAEKIAKRFRWEWRHFQVTPESLYNNIEHTATLGCEFSPIHLHAMSDVSNLNEVDCIIASSYGDSIGRGVYSSRHLLKLTPLHNYVKNWFGLLNNNLFREHKSSVISDLNSYNARYIRTKKWQVYEIERQSVYMRRLLNPCFSIINSKIPVLQTFSAPYIYKFIWSIHPDLRNNYLYEIILKDKIDILGDIPWSKTGKKYNLNDKNELPDKYLKNYHHYAHWIRNELKPFIFEKCLSEEISRTNIFNLETLRVLLNLNSKKKNERLTQIDTFSIWLASLSIFLKQNSKINYISKSVSFRNEFIGISEYMYYETLLALKKKFF